MKYSLKIEGKKRGRREKKRKRNRYNSPRSGMELVGSSWWPLPSFEALALGGGGGGGGLILDVELTTTVAGGGCCVCPPFLWFPRIWVCGDIRTVSPRCPWGGLGHQPCSTRIALLTSACNSAALSLAVWATFNVLHPRPRVTGSHLNISRGQEPLRSASFTKNTRAHSTTSKIRGQVTKTVVLCFHSPYNSTSQERRATTKGKKRKHCRLRIQSSTTVRDSLCLLLRFHRISARMSLECHGQCLAAAWHLQRKPSRRHSELITHFTRAAHSFSTVTASKTAIIW